MSPFVINKYIHSCIGEPRNIKRLRSGDLLIDTISATQSASLLQVTKLGQANVTVTSHKTLNVCRGVISEVDLLYVPEEEIASELSDQNVCGAKRIKMRKEGQLIDTKHVTLTFNSPDLPKNSKAGYLNCPIGHDCENCTAAPLCVNCNGEHPAFSRLCPKWKSEKEVQTTKVTRNISYAEARRLVQSTRVRPNTSYASALKSSRTVATQTSVGIQTQPNKTQPIISSKKKENPTHIVQRKETVIERKPKNLTQKTVNKNRSPSNSSLDGIISDQIVWK
ncbi:hypothetical protein X975_23945, partial [Stegodyphus mimosarum]